MSRHLVWLVLCKSGERGLDMLSSMAFQKDRNNSTMSMSFKFKLNFPFGDTED
jgi:hypothetical protein